MTNRQDNWRIGELSTIALDLLDKYYTLKISLSSEWKYRHHGKERAKLDAYYHGTRETILRLDADQIQAPLDVIAPPEPSSWLDSQ